MKRLVPFAFAVVLAVTAGCAVRSVSVGYYDDSPCDHYNVHVDHVCGYDCHDHYWDGHRVVAIGSRHRHCRGCGHHWDGRHWVIVHEDYDHYNQPNVVISKAPAHQASSPPARIRKTAHVHSMTCGCAWDRRDRVWVKLEDGHVHGRHCGHININGKWCLPR